MYYLCLPGPFLDTIRNSALKHFLAHGFVRDECSSEDGPSFVLKTEDDVFVEMFHLFKFALAIYGERPERSLVCEVMPGRAFKQV